jgi:hypothetical protein
MSINKRWVVWSMPVISATLEAQSKILLEKLRQKGLAVPAYQVQGPELKPQYQKQNKTKKPPLSTEVLAKKEKIILRKGT